MDLTCLALAADIADDADDGCPRGVAAVANAMADRVYVGEGLTGERLADDHHAGAVRSVLGSKQAALQKSEAKGREVAGTDGLTVKS